MPVSALVSLLGNHQQDRVHLLDAPTRVCKWPETLPGDTIGSIRDSINLPQLIRKKASAWPTSAAAVRSSAHRFDDMTSRLHQMALARVARVTLRSLQLQTYLWKSSFHDLSLALCLAPPPPLSLDFCSHCGFLWQQL
jgi:hypothetical protein